MRTELARTREDRVLLELVALGSGDKELADRLGISGSAVKKRLARLRRRLSAPNRISLVRYAIAIGFLDASSCRLEPRSEDDPARDNLGRK